jgi:hypothetical protein
MSFLPRLPRITVPRPKNEDPSPRDFILRPLFALGFAFFDFTVVRLLDLALLLPLYLILAFFRSFPRAIFRNFGSLLSRTGRKKLAERGNISRWQRENQGKLQLDGTFRFHSDVVERTSEIKEVVDKIEGVWPAKREYFDVSNLKAYVVHAVPDETKRSDEGRKLLLLHGNPSWSFMYRNVRALYSTSMHRY